MACNKYCKRTRGVYLILAAQRLLLLGLCVDDDVRGAFKEGREEGRREGKERKGKENVKVMRGKIGNLRAVKLSHPLTKN